VTTIVAVSELRDWALQVPGVEVVLAKDYLSDPHWTDVEGVRVFNLCRRYRYQSEGYYVSLLAMARGHTALPNLNTLLEMRSRTMVRAVDDELEESIQRNLRKISSKEFVLSIYFGENLAKRYAPLSKRLFNLFPAPLLRAHFTRSKGRWRLARIEPIPARLIPEAHLPFVRAAAERYFTRPRYQPRRRRTPRFHLAILVDRKEAFPPSNGPAIRRFARAAEKVGFGVELIERDDFSRLPEFDALFLRATTYVNHYTFRFAQRAQAEGLAVIDDPQSIIRCTNKVYQAEALLQHGLPTPRTVVGNRFNLHEIVPAVGLPCVLKYPDSAFSQGVSRCSSEEELLEKASGILEVSDLFIAQEFVPTEYDWRVGVFAGKPLYACRYHMADGHWQIVKRAGREFHYGRVEPIPLDLVPPGVVRTAVRAAHLIGDGLYGVDLKRPGRTALVMEINDNPNIDVGNEDLVLKDELYLRVMQGLWERVLRLKPSAVGTRPAERR
jgi:glutathione synthase/RimK-type ligase-like ATP-grasp enzyme